MDTMRCRYMYRCLYRTCIVKVSYMYPTYLYRTCISVVSWQRTRIGGCIYCIHRSCATCEPSIRPLLGAASLDGLHCHVISDSIGLVTGIDTVNDLGLLLIREGRTLAAAILGLNGMRHIEHLLPPRLVSVLCCPQQDWALLVEVAPFVLLGANRVPRPLALVVAVRHILRVRHRTGARFVSGRRRDPHATVVSNHHATLHPSPRHHKSSSWTRGRALDEDFLEAPTVDDTGRKALFQQLPLLVLTKISIPSQHLDNLARGGRSDWCGGAAPCRGPPSARARSDDSSAPASAAPNCATRGVDTEIDTPISHAPRAPRYFDAAHGERGAA